MVGRAVDARMLEGITEDDGIRVYRAPFIIRQDTSVYRTTMERTRFDFYIIPVTKVVIDQYYFFSTIVT